MADGHHHFYRAMLRRARYCHGKLSVRPSVRLSLMFSLTLRYRGNISWNSWKIISRLILFALCRPQHDTSTPKGTSPNFSWNMSGVGKIVDFRNLSHRISEFLKLCKIGSKLLLTTNRNMFTRFRLVSKSMILNDL